MKPTNVVTRPALRYHGGKWRLAPWVMSFFPPHRIYVEPFSGGASVLLRKPRGYAEVINDLDGEVVNFFRVARDDGAELRRLLYYTPFARDEFNDAYTETTDPVQRALRTVIRSFMGFGAGGITDKYNTGFRSNVSRSGTTPSHDWRGYAEIFDFVVERLRGVVIENKDAFEVMKKYDHPEALFYVDPPYLHSTRGDMRHGYRHEMDDKEHMRLCEFLMTLKSYVVLSGYQNKIYDGTLKNWRRYDKEARSDKAGARIESIWVSPRTENALSDDWMRGF